MKKQLGFAGWGAIVFSVFMCSSLILSGFTWLGIGLGAVVIAFFVYGKYNP